MSTGKHQPGFASINNDEDVEAQGRLNPHEGAGNEDGFECLFESALEEERSLSKTLSLPNTSRSSSNACCGGSSLGSSKSGMGANGSGDLSMGVEQACESMQEDWKKLLLRMGSAVVQQAWDSAGGVQAENNKLAGEEIPNVKSSSKSKTTQKCAQ